MLGRVISADVNRLPIHWLHHKGRLNAGGCRDAELQAGNHPGARVEPHVDGLSGSGRACGVMGRDGQNAGGTGGDGGQGVAAYDKLPDLAGDGYPGFDRILFAGMRMACRQQRKQQPTAYGQSAGNAGAARALE
jgi:hypothetical protein